MMTSISIAVIFRWQWGLKNWFRFSKVYKLSDVQWFPHINKSQIKNCDTQNTKDSIYTTPLPNHFRWLRTYGEMCASQWLCCVLLRMKVQMHQNPACVFLSKKPKQLRFVVVAKGDVSAFFWVEIVLFWGLVIHVE